ncbi:hypothetical protein L6307_01425 [Candidatus Parcubacteria bacterium]|nr:hypothetical protein [Candidatus Parcubacteria bacterium]
MHYIHKHFNLDLAARKVFDENGKELRLTSNAYRVLVFLCEHGPSTVTDIGDDLDRAKNYNEDHIRQYRYKINTIMGRDVVKYENKMYFVDGKAEKVEEIKENNNPELGKNNRNTVLLREEEYNKSKKINFFKSKLFWLLVVVIIIGIIVSAYLILKPECRIKGNISTSGEKIYHTPGCLNYNETIINPDKGEKWFCSEKEAVEAGWRKALNCK